MTNPILTSKLHPVHRKSIPLACRDGSVRRVRKEYLFKVLKERPMTVKVEDRQGHTTRTLIQLSKVNGSIHGVFNGETCRF